MEENFNQIKLRIVQFTDSQQISIRKFCEKISVNPSNFGTSNMKSSLSSDILSRILITYPILSPDWVLLGRGEMLRSGANAVVQGNSGNVCQGGVQSVVSGAGATVQQPSAQDVESLLAIISQKDIQIAEKDKQIGRLLALLEGGAR